MYKLKSIFRSIIKYPTSLGLNVVSLVISFTGIIFLSLYISYEYSYDKFNENFEQIYQLNFGKESNSIPARAADVIDGKVSGIEDITPLWFRNYSITTPDLKAKNTSFYTRGFFAKNNIFDIFSFPLIYGDKSTALTQPISIVLTESLSHKLFGKTNPVGKKILIGTDEVNVTGVMKDIPKAAIFHGDFIFSFVSMIPDEKSWPHRWSEWSFQIFCKVNPNADIAEINENINRLKEIDTHFNISENNEKIDVFHLDPLQKIHFSTNGNFNIVNPKVLQILGVLILILLLMGFVNFVNLTTAQAYQKAKAFSIKRVMGADKSKVIGQVILEAVIISVLAMLLSFLLHALLQTYLTNLLNMDGFSFTGRTQWYVYFILFAIVFGFVAGIYPAIYINSPKLSESIKGIQNFTAKGKFFRDSLFIMQFVFSTVLIISALGISKQLKFWHHFDMGFNKDRVIYMQVTSEISDHRDAFIKDLINQKSITDYTFSNFVPGSVGMGWGREVNGKQVSFTCWPVDRHFIDFFGIKMVKGRAFSKTKGVDDDTYIFNETAIKKFAWDKPLEMSINGFTSEGKIIGVAKDFNFTSLKLEVGPMAFWLTKGRDRKLLLRLTKNNTTQTLADIKKTWQQYDPLHDFTYTFLDDSLNDLYDKEERISNLIRFVSLWSILLSLTGLLGMVIFNTRNRTKEIGIRKVNGATEIQIVTMLNKDFIKWIAVAFVIAIPIGYYVLNKWLQNFAYKTEISWWLFALAALLVLLVSIITMSWHTWRIARQNPVKSLRYE